jgi:hypothetical protein
MSNNENKYLPVRPGQVLNRNHPKWAPIRPYSKRKAVSLAKYVEQAHKAFYQRKLRRLAGRRRG